MMVAIIVLTCGNDVAAVDCGGGDGDVMMVAMLLLLLFVVVLSVMKTHTTT